MAAKPNNKNSFDINRVDLIFKSLKVRKNTSEVAGPTIRDGEATNLELAFEKSKAGLDREAITRVSDRTFPGLVNLRSDRVPRIVR